MRFQQPGQACTYWNLAPEKPESHLSSAEPGSDELIGVCVRAPLLEALHLRLCLQSQACLRKGVCARARVKNVSCISLCNICKDRLARDT